MNATQQQTNKKSSSKNRQPTANANNNQTVNPGRSQDNTTNNVVGNATAVTNLMLLNSSGQGIIPQHNQTAKIPTHHFLMNTQQQ